MTASGAISAVAELFVGGTWCCHDIAIMKLLRTHLRDIINLKISIKRLRLTDDY